MSCLQNRMNQGWAKLELHALLHVDVCSTMLSMRMRMQEKERRPGRLSFPLVCVHHEPGRQSLPVLSVLSVIPWRGKILPSPPARSKIHAFCLFLLLARGRGRGRGRGRSARAKSRRADARARRWRENRRRRRPPPWRTSTTTASEAIRRMMQEMQPETKTRRHS